jgi:hypothetical protein
MNLATASRLVSSLGQIPRMSTASSRAFPCSQQLRGQSWPLMSEGRPQLASRCSHALRQAYHGTSERRERASSPPIFKLRHHPPRMSPRRLVVCCDADRTCLVARGHQNSAAGPGERCNRATEKCCARWQSFRSSPRRKHRLRASIFLGLCVGIAACLPRQSNARGGRRRTRQCLSASARKAGALFDRGHRLSGQPCKGLNFSFQGDRLCAEVPMLEGVPVAPGCAAAGTVHSADEDPRTAGARHRSPLRFDLAWHLDAWCISRAAVSSTPRMR